ncbi:melanocortin-2 receptor accessory protein 2A isoform X1 [Gadus morhua]|uniref:melanocortin-2 receptor accessory protein 2A isoform X1 n=2 Tax=Gadus morhua TaxID=8049 RepID=UPI0011B6354C|nr:melanocortin-2 receptor accessory protein 2A-like isoform X1 [Gadus morhua]XP_030201785.1 melanocortin-2 receptor accessory protein 2A-like isoform X1 [Gadus morhua]XP_030201786.1 melanocortin-2 receptor accessory protein 2A-like isoform X1 [Gadus morhua]
MKTEVGPTRRSAFEMSGFENQSRANPHPSDYVWQYEYYDDEEPVSFEGLRAHRYSIVIGFWVGLAVFVIFMFFVLTLLTKTGAPPHQDLSRFNRLLKTKPDLTNSPCPLLIGCGELCSLFYLHPSAPTAILRCSIGVPNLSRSLWNPEPSEKRPRPGSALEDFPLPDDPEKAFSRPLLGEPRSFFHFYISEEPHPQHPQRRSAPGEQGGPAGHHPRTGPQGRGRGQPDGHGFRGISASVTERVADEEEEEHDDAGPRPIGGGGRGTRRSADTEDALMSHFDIPNFVNSESPSTSLGDDDLLICETALPPNSPHSRSQVLEAHHSIA